MPPVGADLRRVRDRSRGRGADPVTLRSVLQRPDILDELQKSQKVFAEKLNHLCRRLAWINATIYSKVACLYFSPDHQGATTLVV